jgi:hypothetical protein
LKLARLPRRREPALDAIQAGDVDDTAAALAQLLAHGVLAARELGPDG